MAEPTIEQVFGTGATLASGTLSIPLSGLSNVGLTANGATAEKILVAILLNAAGSTETPGILHPDNWVSNPDQNVQVDADNVPSFTSRLVNGVTRIEKADSIGLTLTKVVGTNTIDPDDY